MKKRIIIILGRISDKQEIVSFDTIDNYPKELKKKLFY